MNSHFSLLLLEKTGTIQTTTNRTSSNDCSIVIIRFETNAIHLLACHTDGLVSDTFPSVCHPVCMRLSSCCVAGTSVDPHFDASLWCLSKRGKVWYQVWFFGSKWNSTHPSVLTPVNQSCVTCAPHWAPCQCEKLNYFSVPTIKILIMLKMFL